MVAVFLLSLYSTYLVGRQTVVRSVLPAQSREVTGSNRVALPLACLCHRTALDSSIFNFGLPGLLSLPLRTDISLVAEV